MGNLVSSEEEQKKEILTEGKLIYFPIRGRGEVIRILLAANNINWEEVNVDYKKMKENAGDKMFPFGQCPIWYQPDGGENGEGEYLSQMDVILRYLGRRTGWYEDAKVHSEWQINRIDEIMSGIESIRGKYTQMIYTQPEETYKEAIKNYEKLHINKESLNDRCGGAHLGFIDLFIKRSKTEWIASTLEPTIADIHAFDIYDLHVHLFPDRKLHDEFPHLSKLYDRFAKIPEIQNYLSSNKRPEKVNNIARG